MFNVWLVPAGRQERVGDPQTVKETYVVITANAFAPTAVTAACFYCTGSIGRFGKSYRIDPTKRDIAIAECLKLKDADYVKVKTFAETLVKQLQCKFYDQSGEAK